MQSPSYPTYYGFILVCLSLSLSLVGCRQDAEPIVIQKSNHIELIQQDIVHIEYAESIQKSPFTGTIRATHQSSIQAQVTATAATVTAQVGQYIKKGQVLAVLNNQDNAARLAQARANLAATQAQTNLAQRMMQRKKRLLDQGFIAQVEYEQSVVDYQAQLENVRAQQANVDIAAKANQDGVIRSPISGVLTQRQVEPGQTVAAGQTLFEILDPQSLELQATLPSEQQSALQRGAKIEYHIQGQSESLTATLTRISPLANPTNRQIEFFATPDQHIQSLSIGSFVEGHILVGQAISGQMIPLDTIHDVNNKPYVWIIRHGKIQKVSITILEQRYDINQAIITGLAPEDMVSRIAFTDAQNNAPVRIN